MAGGGLVSVIQAKRFTALRVNQLVTSLPGATEGHGSGLSLLGGRTGRESLGGRESLSGTL